MVSVRRVAAAAFRPNFRAIDWRFTVRTSLGVAIALFVGLRFGSKLEGIGAAIGAVTVAPTTLRGLHRTRAMATVAAAFGMGAATIVAAAAGESTIAIIAVTAAAAYLYGIFSSFGDAASAVGLNILVVAIVLGNIGIPPSQTGGVAACVVAGGLLQALLVAAFWPLRGYGFERETLATTYRSLAEYARSLATQQSAIPPHEQLQAVRAALADPQPFGRRADLLALQTLADEAERIRLSLSLIASTDAKNATDLLEPATAILEAIARGLLRDARPSETDAWRRARAQLTGDVAWQRLYGQLRAAWRSASLGEAAPGVTLGSDVLLAPHVEDWWRALRQNVGLRSPFGRHAVRVAVALTIAVAIFRLGHVPRGYWIALTAAIVLRPDFTTTYAFGAGRIAGTVVGGLLAWAVASVIAATTAAHAVAATVFAALGLAFLRVGPAFFAIGITGFVVFVLSLVGLQESGAVIARIEATLAGGVLALIVFSAWPTWEAPFTRASLADLFAMNRTYAATVFAVAAGDAALDMADLEERQHAAWAMRSRLSASIERTLTEPLHESDMTPQQALSVLASSQRIGLANLALTSLLDAGDWKVTPQIRPFASAVDAALHSVVGDLRGASEKPALPDLRASYVTLARQLEPAAPHAERLLAQCDLMVDSINTVAETLTQ